MAGIMCLNTAWLECSEMCTQKNSVRRVNGLSLQERVSQTSRAKWVRFYYYLLDRYRAMEMECLYALDSHAVNWINDIIEGEKRQEFMFTWFYICFDNMFIRGLGTAQSPTYYWITVNDNFQFMIALFLRPDYRFTNISTLCLSARLFKLGKYSKTIQLLLEPNSEINTSGYLL